MKERNYELELEALISKALVVEDEEKEESIEDTLLDLQSKTDAFKSKSTDRKSIVCKICTIKDIHYLDGKFNNGCKRWRDSNGLIANGKMCGLCNRNRAKEVMAKARVKNGFAND